LAKGTAYRAEDVSQITESFRQLAGDLVEAESWFLKMNSFSAIADECYRVSNLSKPGKVSNLTVLSAREYGFLLTLASRNAEAEVWLTAAKGFLVKQPVMKSGGSASACWLQLI
jgi:hypothetical protein